MRGLKQANSQLIVGAILVAPYVGAWIETPVNDQAVFSDFMSHPTWVRGLKQNVFNSMGIRRGVAPYVGAWIETYTILTQLSLDVSHPTWVRGLKL